MRNSRRRSAANWHVKLSGQGGRSRRNARIPPLIDPTLWWEHLALRTELVRSIHIFIVLNPVWWCESSLSGIRSGRWHTSSLRCLRLYVSAALADDHLDPERTPSRAGSTSSLAAPSSPRMCSGPSSASHIPDPICPRKARRRCWPEIRPAVSMGRVPVRLDRVRNADRKTAPERLHEVHET